MIPARNKHAFSQIGALISGPDLSCGVTEHLPEHNRGERRYPLTSTHSPEPQLGPPGCPAPALRARPLKGQSRAAVRQIRHFGHTQPACGKQPKHGSDPTAQPSAPHLPPAGHTPATNRKQRRASLPPLLYITSAQLRKPLCVWSARLTRGERGGDTHARGEGGERGARRLAGRVFIVLRRPAVLAVFNLCHRRATCHVPCPACALSGTSMPLLAFCVG